MYLTTEMQQFLLAWIKTIIMYHLFETNYLRKTGMTWSEHSKDVKHTCRRTSYHDEQ